MTGPGSGIRLSGGSTGMTGPGSGMTGCCNHGGTMPGFPFRGTSPNHGGTIPVFPFDGMLWVTAEIDVIFTLIRSSFRCLTDQFGSEGV